LKASPEASTVKSQATLILALLMPLAAPAMAAPDQKPDYVSGEEEDKIIEAQDPSERIYRPLAGRIHLNHGRFEELDPGSV
jgi:hypothetical protein